jgi:putative ABC transport system substrate-binding protein
MRRREFIPAFGGAVAWPLVARGQQSVKKIGVLWHAGNEQEEAIFLGALRQGLHERGYIEGKNIELLNRFAGEHYDRFDALAKELVDFKVDVIVASIGLAALAAKRASTMIPVVFVAVPDPLGLRLVDSLAHPGGNLTGFSLMSSDLAAKRLEILKDYSLPRLSRVALLYNPNGEFARRQIDDTQAAARSTNVMLSLIEARAPSELEQSFFIAAQNRVGGLIIGSDALFYNERQRIADLALAHRLPTLGGVAEMADSGVLITYGPDFGDIFRRAANYVDEILKGAKPAGLPVEQPTKFKLVSTLELLTSSV